MTANTGNQQFTYPLKSDSPGYIAEYIETAVKQIEKNVVLRFTSATDRDTRMTGIYAPVTGQLCLLTDTMKLLKYNGAAWVDAIPIITVSTADPSGGNNGDVWLKI